MSRLKTVLSHLEFCYEILAFIYFQLNSLLKICIASILIFKLLILNQMKGLKINKQIDKQQQQFSFKYKYSALTKQQQLIKLQFQRFNKNIEEQINKQINKYTYNQTKNIYKYLQKSICKINQSVDNQKQNYNNRQFCYSNLFIIQLVSIQFYSQVIASFIYTSYHNVYSNFQKKF
ncbi:transmembrane protein, putative (macronuclear) [Tetrahymena thermophila SB210]|uniref:Transmembrane protein, putative n=1 Tax=Tetrahymena thermophila (strain SB210) TaxID=312017 RepID=W7XHD3_TETTS|nr:transmembrane protein, putative [Tetrahymena thermophila SB210]EWS73761.1 transmembrane protein, putative [Tetrahymena thermophila SB210]|eukprot:XP_012653725.1 transmembrane protein, putative [Tetrahymena thermophila SB210]